ncbi:MAG TPA: D-aminoacylase [Chthonomonadaceae bacterium]|nr:D-aminoacylase [Chthonomonadaceae bacterium]
MFDLCIRGAQVVDGSGGPRFAADIGIVADRIAVIGHIPPEAHAAQTLDATGLVAAPGFVDIHTHADIALMARPAHLPKVMQGVTTEVFTNCGLGFAPITEQGLAIQRRYIAGLFGDDGSRTAGQKSAAPEQDAAAGEVTRDGRGAAVDWKWRTVAEFLSRFERQGTGANIAYLIPHGSVRVSVMGMEERHADRAEIAAMVAMVAQGMDEGAWGLSTGIWYAPMRAAGQDEVVALTRAAGFFATHQRDYGDQIFSATDESLGYARDAGVPIQIAHLQMNGPDNAGRAGALLDRLERARAAGIDVTCDTYPYTAGSTFIQTMLPGWAVQDGPEAILRGLAEPETRARMVAAIADAAAERPGGPGWERYSLVGAQSAKNRPLEGLTFEAAADRRGMAVPEWICAVLEEDELRACYVHHAAHEGNVREVLQWPGQMIGSDGLHLPGKTHPRLYGTFPRVLGKYVRDEGVISLEEAVRKMSGLPAERLGLKQRGLLREGFAADLTLFDPATVCDTATFDDPLRFPTGVPYVFVNGVAAKWRDEATHALPGRVLRKQ